MIQNRIIPYLGYLPNGYVIFKPESVGSTSEKDYHGKCTSENSNRKCRTVQDDLKN